MKRTHLILIGLLTALISTIVSPVHAAPNPVNQGDTIYIVHKSGGASICTAGFVDTENGRIWTAGHCGNHGDEVYNSARQKIGELIYRWPEVVNGIKTATTDEERQTAATQFLPYDIAYIQLADSATAGKNDYSGSRVYTPVEQDRVCMYGQTTKTVKCGLILKIDDYFIYGVDLGSNSGDSGGPAWVPGKGYVGQIVAGRTMVRKSDRKEATTLLIHRHDIAQTQTQFDPTATYEYLNPKFQEIWDNPATASDRLTEFGRELPGSAEWAELIDPLEEAQANTDAAITRENDAAARIEEINNLQAEIAVAEAEKQRLETEIATHNQGNQKRAEELAALNTKLAELHKQLDTAEAAKLQAELEAAKQTESHLETSKPQPTGSSESDIFLSVLGIILAVAGFLAPVISRLLPM